MAFCSSVVDQSGSKRAGTATNFFRGLIYRGDVPTQPQEIENHTKRHHGNGPSLRLQFISGCQLLEIYDLLMPASQPKENKIAITTFTMSLLTSPLFSFYEQQLHTPLILQRHHPPMIYDTCCPAAPQVGPHLRQ